MKAFRVIPINFKIPAKYSRQFIFSTRKVRVVILVKNKKLGMADMRLKGKRRRDDSQALDWIHETMENIRYECENP